MIIADVPDKAGRSGKFVDGRFQTNEVQTTLLPGETVVFFDQPSGSREINEIDTTPHDQDIIDAFVLRNLADTFLYVID